MRYKRRIESENECEPEELIVWETDDPNVEPERDAPKGHLIRYLKRNAIEMGSLRIPDGVTSLGADLFYDDEVIGFESFLPQKLIIPVSVKKIDENAFSYGAWDLKMENGCTALKYDGYWLLTPDGRTLMGIDQEKYLDALTNALQIFRETGKPCPEIGILQIPAGVRNVQANVSFPDFYEKVLFRIVFPESVETISETAFWFSKDEQRIEKVIAPKGSPAVKWAKKRKLKLEIIK